MYSNTTVALKSNFMSFIYAYSSITLKILNLHGKDPKKDLLT